MNEFVKFWLIDLYEKAIEETKKSIENNRIFILGATTKEEQNMFIQNERDMQEYIKVLAELKNTFEEEL